MCSPGFFWPEQPVFVLGPLVSCNLQLTLHLIHPGQQAALLHGPQLVPRLKSIHDLSNHQDQGGVLLLWLNGRWDLAVHHFLFILQLIPINQCLNIKLSYVRVFKKSGSPSNKAPSEFLMELSRNPAVPASSCIHQGSL